MNRNSCGQVTRMCLVMVILTATSVTSAYALTNADIQAAIDALPSEGGVVQLQAGTYQLFDTVWIKDNVTIKGAGIDQTILRLENGVNKAPIENDRYDILVHWTDGNHDMTISDLTIDGNCANNGDMSEGGICLPNAYNYRIQNVHVMNTCGWGGIYTNPNHWVNQQGVFYRNYIVDCHVEGTIGVYNPDLFGDENRHYGEGMFITAYDNENVLIRGNVCHDNQGNGILLEDCIDFITVEYNHCYDNGGGGIGLDLTGRSIVRFNRCENNAGRGIAASNGFHYDAWQGVYNMIYGNEVSGNGFEGILLAYPGVNWSESSSYMVVVNNTVKNNCWHVYASTGIVCDFQGNVVAFNKVYDDQATPTQITPVSAIANNYVFGNSAERHIGAFADSASTTDDVVLPTSSMTESLVESELSSPMSGDDIQAQIDALGGGGGTVTLQAGIYLIRKSIIVRDNVTLAGAGMDQTILFLANDINQHVILNEKWDENIYAEGNHDITVRDLTIDGNNRYNPHESRAVLLANCYNFRFENVHALDCAGEGALYSNPNHLAASQGIPYQNYIVGCIVEGTTASRPGPYGNGIYITAWDDDHVLVRGNVLRNNSGAGIFLEDLVEYITVEFNNVYGNQGMGIWANRTLNSIIRFNVVYDNGGQGIDADGDSKNNVIYGNEVWNNRGEGITLLRPGTEAWSSDSVVFTNTIKNNGQGPSATIGIRVTSENNYIYGNYIYDDQLHPTQTAKVDLGANNVEQQSAIPDGAAQRTVDYPDRNLGYRNDTTLSEKLQ